jgi:hypothetical protein
MFLLLLSLYVPPHHKCSLLENSLFKMLIFQRYILAEIDLLM